MTGFRRTGLDETGRLLGQVLRAALSEATERRLALRRAMGKGALGKGKRTQTATGRGLAISRLEAGDGRGGE